MSLRRTNKADLYFRRVIFAFAASIPLLLAAFFLALVGAAWPALTRFGFSFVWGSTWDPVQSIFGVLPFIYGTLLTSLLALTLAVPLGVGTAIYLSEISSPQVRDIISQMVELLAAIPSIVYGLWGIFVLAPLVQNGIGPALQRVLGFLPIFQGPIFGLSAFTAGLILSIMILPTITSVTREVFQAIPKSYRESALALGSTKWETFKMAIFGPAKAGIMGAIILGLGRALGETMAVTMVIGNRPEISGSLFAPGYTLASLIANEFSEASGSLYLNSLIEAGLVLLAITLMVNAIARLIIWRTTSFKTHI